MNSGAAEFVDNNDAAGEVGPGIPRRPLRAHIPRWTW
jgi:hypothetical protein